MKKRNTTNAGAKPDKSGPQIPLSIKLEQPIHDRFCRVAEATRRTKTSIVLEALEDILPRLEKRHEQLEAA